MKTYYKVIVIENVVPVQEGFPGDSAVKNPTANARDTGLIPGLGRSPGEGNGNPLQYSCLGNQSVGLGSKESDTT